MSDDPPVLPIINEWERLALDFSAKWRASEDELNQATELLHKSNVAAADDAKTLAEQRSELERLRAENAQLVQILTACNEVAAGYKVERDWFRLREVYVRAALCDGTTQEVFDFEKQHPQPGAAE